MQQVGSSVAVYPSHSSKNILEVIEQLQTIKYSAKQLSVIGVEKIQPEFWKSLRALLDGNVLFRSSESISLSLVGDLSARSLMLERNRVQQDMYSELYGLFDFVGIPETSFAYYETIIKSGHLMLIAYGDHQEIENTGNLMECSSSIDVSLHFSNTS